jgi:hypothetical protein
MVLIDLMWITVVPYRIQPTRIVVLRRDRDRNTADKTTVTLSDYRFNRRKYSGIAFCKTQDQPIQKDLS